MVLKQYKKGDTIREFGIESGKVLDTLFIGGVWVCCPTEQQIIDDGWVEIIPPTPEPVLPTIEELVEGKLRERYTINQEFEVNRKRDTEPEQFAAYYAYVEECIAWANEQPHK